MIEIDGYSDVSRIGHGGLGDVYKATRDSTGGTVAIKVLRDVSDESVAWNRTRRELTALVALAGHANVIQLIELLDLPEGPSMVMEYAPGGSVAELLQRRDSTLTVGETVLVGQHVAAALVAAHEQGIVHRDIKPQNLLIDAYGQVKLCDFGIATLMRSDDFRARTSALSMRYASPEDLDDEADVGSASDVYSLGATLLHLARGAPPTMRERMADWQAPETDDAEMAELDAVIASCLHPAPSDRPSASQVLDDLERLAWTVDERRRALVFDPPTVLPEPDDQVTDPRPAGTGSDRDDAASHDGVGSGVGVSSGAESDDEVAGPGASGRASADEDATVQRPRATPTRPLPASPARERRVWPIAVAILAAVAVIGVGTWTLWPADSDDDGATTSVPESSAPAPLTIAATATAASPTSTTPATRPTTTPTTAPPTTTQPAPLVLTPRPADLEPLTDSLWPFGSIGECLVQTADSDGLEVVDCAQPHDLQRFGEGVLDDELGLDPSQFTAIINTEVDRLCREAFDDFVGHPVAASELQFASTAPSPGTWLEDDRRYQCLLGVADQRVEGDARDSSW